MHCGKPEGYCITAQAEETVRNWWRTPALSAGIVQAAAGWAPESRDTQSQEGAGTRGCPHPHPSAASWGPQSLLKGTLCPGTEISLLLLLFLLELPEVSLSLRSQCSNLSFKFQAALCFWHPDLGWWFSLRGREAAPGSLNPGPCWPPAESVRPACCMVPWGTRSSARVLLCPLLGLLVDTLQNSGEILPWAIRSRWS